MPLIETTGSASAKALGLNSASGPVNYIEDVFSTYLYTGNGATRTITNGLDVSGKGGLVWIKNRSRAVDHGLYDTNRGALNGLASNSTTSQQAYSDTLTGFTSSGFTLGADSSNTVNLSNDNYASWTFRKQPKFFDVVTYTGDGVAGRQISHNLGSVPGCIIVKCTSGSANWLVWHRSSSNEILSLNLTNAYIPGYSQYIRNADASNFTIATAAQPSAGTVNASGESYVAYLFAHDAGGFGASGADNVISCGSFTTDTSGNATVNLGYEPQWVLTKRVDNSGNWVINDNMRGMPASQTSQVLYPNLSTAELSSIYFSTQPNATGFTTQNYANTSYDGVAATVIYIAIRRGPMKTPTSGTSVFNVVSRTGNGTSGAVVDAGFPVDLAFVKRNTSGYPGAWEDRLRGNNTFLSPNLTDQQYNGGNTVRFTTNQNGVSLGTDSWVNASSQTYFNFFFRRAAGFFDEVCWSYGTFPTYHNLGVVPEMIIQKRTDAAGNWAVFTSNSYVNALALNLTDSYSGWGGGIDWSATSTTFNVTSVAGAGNHVAYLFASCPGVSKVGSYTGTGSTQTISCGFAARWVMIKRTDSTGNWWYWDTTRGMVSGTDPRLAMNTNDAQTNADWVYTNASGFQIVTTDATVNASGGSYIYLAIA